MSTKYDNSEPHHWSLETQAIHAGQPVDSDTGARNLPLYLTTSYVFNSAEHAKQRFALEDLGPIYSRLTNPTNEVLENRLAALEGGVYAVSFASGQAAETAAIFDLSSGWGSYRGQPPALRRHAHPIYWPAGAVGH